MEDFAVKTREVSFFLTFWCSYWEQSWLALEIGPLQLLCIFVFFNFALLEYS